jgi:hypothetical protein
VLEFDCIYVPVDSVVDGEQLAPFFDISELQDRGIGGWDIAGVIPRTLGVSLKNETIGDITGYATSYGGGIGGNVVGVHILLRRQS